MVRILTILFILTLSIESKTFTFNEVHKMPLSVAKDYYIWRFLTQKSTNIIEAKTIITEASKLNKKLRVSYKAKTGRYPSKLAKRKREITPFNPNWRNRGKAHKSFYRGIALMKKNQPSKAYPYFSNAYNKYFKRYDKDKSLFWLYLSTKNTKYLKELTKSYHINIYTMVACDTLHTSYPYTITQSIRKSKTYGFDITDAIDWAKLKTRVNRGYDLDNLADDYCSQECIGVYTYIKARACKYRKSYFPMPYRSLMKYMPKQRQALIYAIARQETRFIPASISPSFALGMMQFMPFLIKHVSKKKGDHIDLDDMFNPYKAIEYADYHLDYLEKYLKHPLFIAYAYNGGIGFTRRFLKNKKHFKNAKYEPYLTMESMKNKEAKEYGKKVLANYVIYMNKLGIKIKMLPLINKIVYSNSIGRF